MEMTIDFPGGARVDAHFAGFVVPTDQPPQGGGQGSAPTPFATFLSTIGTCAGIYVLGFCQQRGIPTDGIRLVQRMQTDPATRLVSDVQVTIELPVRLPGQVRRRGRSRRRAVRGEEALRAPAGHPRGEHHRRLTGSRRPRQAVRASGRSIQNRAPPSGGFSTPVLPPWASTMARVMARPSPEVPEPRSRLGSTW